MRKASLLITIAAAAALWSVQPPAYAADPPEGTVSSSQDVTWRGGPFTVSNPTVCAGSVDPTCDHFALTVEADEGTHVMVAIATDVSGDDYDLYVYFPDGLEAAHSQTVGNDQVVFEHHTNHGVGPYEVRVQPYLVIPGSTYQGAATIGRDPVDLYSDTDLFVECPNISPPDTTCVGVTDSGQDVSLDAVILLDGVSQARGEVVMAKAAESYAPLRISLHATFRDVAFTGNEVAGLFDQAKALFVHGERPPGSDVVYILTAKDIKLDGAELRGYAYCIGGVRYPWRAFAVGEETPENQPLGPFTTYVDATAKVAAHEIGHLLGGFHEPLANCAEGATAEELAAGELSPCTVMFSRVQFESLNFSIANAAVVRSYAVNCMDAEATRPPVAVDDAATTEQDTPVTIDVLANDSDPDGDALSVTAVGDPPHGAAMDNGDGTVTYTPDPGFLGVDSFGYTVSDGFGGSDDATVTVRVNENQDPNACGEIDDSDPPLEYSGGWHRRNDARASNSGYTRRLGSHGGGNGSTPVARLVFSGDELTYFYVKSDIGGTADISIDGQLMETLSYGTNLPGQENPTFGHFRRYSGLGSESHTLVIEHRTGAVYIDGFGFTCPEGAGDADPLAPTLRSVTETTTAPAGEGPLIERTISVGAEDRELSVVVEGSSAPLTVNLIDPLGTLVASGQALVAGFSASGLDQAVSAAGAYRVQVVRAPSDFNTIEISTARTVSVSELRGRPLPAPAAPFEAEERAEEKEVLSSGQPLRFELGQNHPNPFNPHTRITLALPVATPWRLDIYSVSGELVRRFDGHVGAPGTVNLDWDATNEKGEQVAPGVYFYRAAAGKFTATKKTILLK